MARAKRSRKTTVTVVVLVLLSVTILTANAQGDSSATGVRGFLHDVTQPVVSSLQAVFRPVGNFFAGSVNYGRVTDENAQLRYTLNHLQQQAVTNSLAEAQLQQVLALQHLPFIGSTPTVMARTIDVGRSNFTATITLDKGTTSGVLVGMPVVGSGGLVGRVISVSAHSATVRLVTDASSSVSVAFPSMATEQAIVHGEGPDAEMSALYLPTGAKVTKGSLLLTSGLTGGVYPSGIPVGTVTSASSVAGAGGVDVTVSPAADLSNLGYVDVLQWTAGS
jgi:rod shape-determining protein MreC